jgi:2'-5' RNA ligase
MVQYVTDTSKWEKWQRDYRLGLILIMPPEEVAKQINPLRAKYDPRTYAYCPAHITLSDPLGLELTPEREAEIAEILRQIDPFTLYFDEPQASRERGGVAYPIRPREPIDALRAALHQASVFCRPPYYTRTIAPHMTIAEFVTIEESWRIMEEIKGIAPRGSFVCDRLEFIVPDINMHFQRVKSFFLGDRAKAPQQCDGANAALGAPRSSS